MGVGVGVGVPGADCSRDGAVFLPWAKRAEVPPQIPPTLFSHDTLATPLLSARVSALMKQVLPSLYSLYWYKSANTDGD